MLTVLIATACSSGDDEDEVADARGGTGGAAGSHAGGSAGSTGGTSGTSGVGGSGGTSGSAGAAATGGSAGGAGNGGAAGSAGGAAGSGGGAAGSAGGAAGSAGSGGTPAIQRPFPQQLSFPNSIKPNHLPQADLDQTVASYFDDWKATYVKPSNGNTPGGGYYVAMKGTGGSGSEITTSEAHGYGMILFALMAGHDPAARDVFDGFFNMYDKHRSTIDHDLMSWVIDESESTSEDQASATDGDMDVAYALLLADAQWGSAGGVDYRAEAVRIIQDGIKPSEMGASSHRTLLGDWSSDEWATRSSDWMTGHFHAYGAATGDAFWSTAATTAYDMIGHMRANHAPSTGLMPDFVVGTTPHPASPYFLEAETDGAYSWNACRFPLRMAVDYAHNGSPAARDAILAILAWLVPKTGNDPEKIVAGYSLEGQKLVSYTSSAFTGPLVAASVADSSRQEFLNEGFSLLAQDKSGYYEDTLALLSMLLITGNWWSP